MRLFLQYMGVAILVFVVAALLLGFIRGDFNF